MGLALAQAHAHLGWRISVVGSSADKVAHLQAQQPEWGVYRADLGDEGQRQALFAKLDALAPFERVVYAAGVYANERRFDLSAEESTTMLAINVQAFQAAFAWAAQRVAGKEAALVCFSSIAALVDYPTPAYTRNANAPCGTRQQPIARHLRRAKWRCWRWQAAMWTPPNCANSTVATPRTSPLS